MQLVSLDPVKRAADLSAKTDAQGVHLSGQNDLVHDHTSGCHRHNLLLGIIVHRPIGWIYNGALHPCSDVLQDV